MNKYSEALQAGRLDAWDAICNEMADDEENLRRWALNTLQKPKGWENIYSMLSAALTAANDFGSIAYMVGYVLTVRKHFQDRGWDVVPLNGAWALVQKAIAAIKAQKEVRQESKIQASEDIWAGL